MNISKEKLEAIERGVFKASKDVFNVQECADYMGVSKNVLYKWTSRNEIQHHKVGRHIFFKKADIGNFLERYRVPCKADFIQQQTEKGLRKEKRAHYPIIHTN